MASDTLFSNLIFKNGSRKRRDGTAKHEENPVIRYGGGVLGIVLDREQIALVDEDDYIKIVGFHWYASLRNNPARETYTATASALHCFFTMQKVVLGIDARSGVEIDHYDGNSLNNRRNNLRDCAHSYNMHNRPARVDNALGIKGVCRRENGKYRAQIRKDGALRNLGTFVTIEDAYAAYRSAASELFGDFCNPQFLENQCST